MTILKDAPPCFPIAKTNFPIAFIYFWVSGDVCTIMTCTFQSLYFGDDGYVVRCKECGHYQVAYMCIMFTVAEYDFYTFCDTVKQQCQATDLPFSDNSKCIVVNTPTPGICFLFTKSEAERFAEILEQADNEARALTLLSLFNP